MKNLTEQEEERIGQRLVEILMLRKDPDHRGRYLTTVGNKTPLGIARTVLRIIQEKGEGL